jgi:hypothetical protein
MLPAFHVEISTHDDCIPLSKSLSRGILTGLEARFLKNRDPVLSQYQYIIKPISQTKYFTEIFLLHQKKVILLQLKLSRTHTSNKVSI